MEKSSGRNGKHANQDAKSSADNQFEKISEEYEKLKIKPGKTKEDIALLKKLKKQVKHWRNKKDWTGEHHSQKSKGK